MRFRWLVRTVVTTTFLSGWCALATPSLSAQVWFSPDNDSPDYIELFRRPGQWAMARSKIAVFKFGPQQVDGRSRPSKNTLADLKGVDAFRKLRAWNMGIAIEAPAIKKWDCTGGKTLEYTQRMIDNVVAAGGGCRFYFDG